MYKQTEILFDQAAGQHLAEVGLSLAVETANAEHEKWSDRCWQLFWQWLNRKPKYFEFMIEDFRAYLYEYDLIERPQSDRAFGFISKRALKEGLVTFNGTKKVANKKAHCANASCWVKL